MEAKKNTIEPITKTRLHEEIAERLKDAIIAGDIRPGQRLPTERELADSFKVNRSTVREALKKLEGLELIEIRHGSGVFARDYLESASLELVKGLLLADGGINAGVLEELMELRSLIVPRISQLAARNRSDSDLAALDRVVFHSDEMDMAEKDWRVHNLIARASGNLLFVIVLNAFTDLAGDSGKLYFANEKNRRASERFHRDIYEAIKKRQPERARKIMEEVLEYAAKATLEAASGGSKKRARKKE